MSDFTGRLHFGCEPDWEHAHDYAPDDVQWIDTTIIGGEYHTQIAENAPLSRYRHRASYGPWTKGEPPK